MPDFLDKNAKKNDRTFAEKSFKGKSAVGFFNDFVIIASLELRLRQSCKQYHQPMRRVISR